MNRVKENLEQGFDIKIIGGYFCYIFTDYSNDETSLKFCEKYNIPYLNFSFMHMEFDKNNPFTLDKCLITNDFPFHNYFSILPAKKFNFQDTINNNNYDDIIKYKNIFILEPINYEIQQKLSFYFKVEVNEEQNEFAIFGFFDKKENFSAKFCIWYDVKKKEINYYENNEERIEKINLDFTNFNNREKNWILICSKFKYIFHLGNEKKKRERKNF